MVRSFIKFQADEIAVEGDTLVKIVHQDVDVLQYSTIAHVGRFSNNS